MRPFVTLAPPVKLVKPLTFIPPLATTRPALIVAPPFKNAPADVVRVLLIAVALLRTTCVGDIVFPPQLSVPVPDCVKLPLMVAVEMARVDGIPPPPGGGYVAPFTLLTLRLLIASADAVAVGWITGTHWPNIWIDETLLVM